MRPTLRSRQPARRSVPTSFPPSGPAWDSARNHPATERTLDIAGLSAPRRWPVSGNEAHLPELVPVLSRGKHRSPRHGACFMELASYLAGERWSDHPACTHPLLAALARDVNDYSSDAARSRLARMIPSVIGLTGEDLHIDARIALLCARTALPVAAAPRQQVMAVSVLACERVLAALDGRPTGWPDEQSRAALAQVPLAA